MKAQLASPTFSPLYAALVSVANTKFPELGELLCHRVIAQFKRAYKRNDKPITIAAAKFVAHLINQGVLHEVSLTSWQSLGHRVRSRVRNWVIKWLVPCKLFSRLWVVP